MFLKKHPVKSSYPIIAIGFHISITDKISNKFKLVESFREIIMSS